MEQTRKFKRVNVLGLDFYVDWIEETGEFIAIKEVHSGKRFVYESLILNDGMTLADKFREAVGIPLKEVKKKAEKKEAVAPAAQVTEQPKEETNETRETSVRKGKK